MDSYAPKKRRLMGEINVVPYIDVMLVLLIIFMITAPMLSTGVEVDLPDADADPIPNAEDILILTIDSSGLYYLEPLGNGDEPLTESEVRLRVAAAMKRKAPEASRSVSVRADSSVPHGDVMKAMVILQAAGVDEVGFATEPKD